MISASTAVEVGLIDLDESTVDIARLLSEIDIERSRRFDDPRHRRRFAAGRAAVRSALGSVLGLDPAKVPIETGRHGKPYVVDGPCFSFSGSGRWGLLVMSHELDLGVDIEEVTRVDVWAMSQRVFVPQELAEMRRARDSRVAFFQLWTMKEAVAKARGVGFSVEPDSYGVSLRGRVLSTPDGSSAEDWTVSLVDAPVGFVAALATCPR
jgi:4'-phosphopantetheinyl transferase